MLALNRLQSLKNRFKVNNKYFIDYGTEYVASLTRIKYWIIGVKQIAKHINGQCMTCRRMFSEPAIQKMCDLPSDRTALNTPQFTYVGIDFFGHL